MSMTLDAITLPDEMMWVDEFTWSSVEATKDETLGSKLIVSESAVSDDIGRPITLTGDYAWAERSIVESLHSMYQSIGLEMTLTLHDTRQFNVRFRHWETPAFIAEPVVSTAFPTNTTLYVVTLKLVKV